MDPKIRGDLFYTVVYVPNYYKKWAFHGYVKSISGINSEGNFDILPLHENFVSTVKNQINIVDERDQTHQIPINQALVEASNNLVKIFVEF